MNINKKQLISEGRQAPGSCLDLYGMELAKYIAEEFYRYGVDVGLNGGKYEASEVYRGNSDMDEGRHIDVIFNFFMQFGKDSDVTADDKKVFINFLKDIAWEFFYTHKYPLYNRCIGSVKRVWADPISDYELDDYGYLKGDIVWEFSVTATEAIDSQSNLGMTIDEVAKNIGKSKPVKEGVLPVIKYPKELFDEIIIPAEYELKQLTYTENFKYWDQFKPVYMYQLPRYKYSYSTNNPLYGVVNMVGIYKKNPDIILVWRYHDKNKIAYLLNKADYDKMLQILTNYFKELEVKLGD